MESLGFGPGSEYYENRWTVSTNDNASGSFNDYGFELEASHDLGFLGSFGRHFYVFGSYFQQFQKAGSVPEEESDLFVVPEGTETRINASGGINFSYKRLNLRANFTWRNERLESISEVIIWDDPTIGNPGWYTPTAADLEVTPYTQRVRLMRPSDLRIDISGSIRLTERFYFDFSARNITESNPEPVYVLESGESLGPTRYRNVHDGSDKIIFGINFTLGISATF